VDEVAYVRFPVRYLSHFEDVEAFPTRSSGPQSRHPGRRPGQPRARKRETASSQANRRPAALLPAEPAANYSTLSLP